MDELVYMYAQQHIFTSNERDDGTWESDLCLKAKKVQFSWCQCVAAAIKRGQRLGIGKWERGSKAPWVQGFSGNSYKRQENVPICVQMTEDAAQHANLQMRTTTIANAGY